MKKYIKYLLLGIGIALFVGMPWIVVQLFAGMSGGGGGTGTGTVTSVTGTSPIVSSEGTTPAISLTLLKDVVGAAPLTINGGTNVDNILPGADADLTLAISDVFLRNDADDTTVGSITIDNQKSLKLMETDAGGTNYVAFKSSAVLAGDTTWILPDADGTVGQLIKTDGAGNLGWANPGAGTGDLLADGTVPLTADWDIGNFSITGRDLVATYGVAAATGVFSGALSGATINTGDGAFEIGQSLQTTSDVTFNSITTPSGITAAQGTFTGVGLSQVNAGLVVNQDGGTVDATDLFRVETNTEENMIITVPSGDTMYLAGSTNGVKFTKGGAMEFAGTAAGNSISGMTWEKNFTVTSPSNTYIVAGSSVPVIAKLTKGVTIDSVFVCLDSDPTTEIDCDLKSVTNPSGWVSPVIINSLDTATGQLTDTSITAGTVAAGSCIYLNFHAAPDALTKFMSVTISGQYD